MTNPIHVAVLGSTGSIGEQTLDVASRAPDVVVTALAANSRADEIVAQARRFDVSVVALADADAATRARALADRDGGPPLEVRAGPDAVADLAVSSEAEIVLNALVGAAGLRASIATLDAGRTLALANKESLVAGGELVTSRVDGNLIPVDSEHSAIFQCLEGERAADVARIWLTASGGPFRGRSADELEGVTRDEALAHPTWTMGPKITIDSATLMNKGLEVIEAHHLFSVPYDAIRVVVHPQSIVHSMVEFRDASVKAHLGTTDMRIPIQYALSYPRRWDAPVAPADFTSIGSLEFSDPDREAFPALGLAFAAGRAGGTMPAVLNAANEIAVAWFLEGRARFTDIPRVVERVMERHDRQPLHSVDQVEDVDRWARRVATSILSDDER